jgi:hypothetical protein
MPWPEVTRVSLREEFGVPSFRSVAALSISPLPDQEPCISGIGPHDRVERAVGCSLQRQSGRPRKASCRIANRAGRSPVGDATRLEAVATDQA